MNEFNIDLIDFAVVLSESVPTDIDRLLLGLEVKEFTVEASTLQSLQQLIQWVADLALNILARLPDSRGSRCSGVSISRELPFLALIFLLTNVTRTSYFFSMILARI